MGRASARPPFAPFAPFALSRSDDTGSGAGELALIRFDGRKEIFPGFEFENTDQDGDGPESLQHFLDACLGNEYYPGADASVGLKAVATLDALCKKLACVRFCP